MPRGKTVTGNGYSGFARRRAGDNPSKKKITC